MTTAVTKVDAKDFNQGAVTSPLDLNTVFMCLRGQKDFPTLVETGVTFEDSDILLISGQSDTIRARFEPNILTQRSYSWKVDDPSVADVQVNADKSATVTATGSGETTIISHPPFFSVDG